MARSLFVLMLVGMMVAVGLYYEHVANHPDANITDAMAGTVVEEASASAAVSGVNLQAIDRDTRPQDDFYQFANGGWLDETTIPEIYSGYTVYHQVREDTETALRSIIEDAAANPGEKGTESQQVGDIYNAWMDIETINKLGTDPVRAELAQIAAIADRDDLVNVMAQLKRKGVSAPYGFYV